MENRAEEFQTDQSPDQSKPGSCSASDKFSHLNKNFLSATMPQVIAASSCISLIWGVFYFCFLAVLVWQALLTVKDYFSYPVNVEFTIETDSNFLAFPAVTVCNNNIVKKSYVARIPKYKGVWFMHNGNRLTYHCFVFVILR